MEQLPLWFIKTIHSSVLSYMIDGGYVVDSVSLLVFFTFEVRSHLLHITEAIEFRANNSSFCIHKKFVNLYSTTSKPVITLLWLVM